MPLDQLLGDGALGGLQRWLPGKSAVQMATHLALQPRTVARRGLGLTRKLAKVAVGTSSVAPSKRDKRFADPAWTGNPALRRALQAYLVTSRTLEELLDDAHLDWRSDQRMRFVVTNLISAMAPSNNPLLNPMALRAGLDTGGQNYRDGLRHLVKDMALPPRVPEMVDKTAFGVGRNLGVTPGWVVARTELFELIRYDPQTEQVREVPVLVVPPAINKYYVTDLAPGRSMLEHFVQAGHQVFVMSWRNPDARHADWGLDTYVGSVLEALLETEKLTGSRATQLFGLCSGGITASIAASHLHAIGESDRLAGLFLGVTVLDHSRAGTASAMIDRQVAALASSRSARRGYLDGRMLAELFAWLRPDDLVWNYWVNNYLLGKRPPAFDVLFWNADTTRLAARLHRDFLSTAVDNALVEPGSLTLLGQPVDLSQVKTDAYVLSGIADHICPWESTYRTTQMLGGESRFVLSTNGHIAALVNPPSNPKSSYQLGDGTPASAEGWLAGARVVKGSWWPDYVDWLSTRSGELVDAPTEPAGGREPLAPAPGTYVFDT